jgi:hypothetical protein
MTVYPVTAVSKACTAFQALPALMDYKAIMAWTVKEANTVGLC